MAILEHTERGVLHFSLHLQIIDVGVKAYRGAYTAATGMASMNLSTIS